MQASKHFGRQCELSDSNDVEPLLVLSTGNLLLKSNSPFHFCLKWTVTVMKNATCSFDLDFPSLLFLLYALLRSLSCGLFTIAFIMSALNCGVWSQVAGMNRSIQIGSLKHLPSLSHCFPVLSPVHIYSVSGLNCWLYKRLAKSLRLW